MLSDEEKTKMEYLRVSNMDEILEECMTKNWSTAQFQAWCVFKIAQYLEKIANP